MISIICPFYNERENLEELFSRLLASAEIFHDSWEMLFVDDGSTDEGGVFLKSLIQNHPHVQLIELETNKGLTTALYAGFQHAKGDILATLDADLQNPPEELPRLLVLLEEHVHMVTGIRKKRRDNWLRKFSSSAANWIRKSVLRDRILDIGCSLRIFRRPVLDMFYPYKGMHRFFPAIADREGYSIIQVPVEHHPRQKGKSKYGLFNRLLGPLWDLIAVKWLLTNKIKYRIKNYV